MQIERGASNTLVVMARVTLSPSYWLLHFTDIERGGNAYCVVQPGNSGGAFISLTFTETTAPVALDGEVLLAPPGNWNVKIYEQTSSTNLVPASANRLVKDVDVFVVGDGVADGGWTETCPTDGGECDPLSYSLVNSNNDELDGGSVPDPCGETLTLNAPDANIRTTDTLLNVAQVPSGDTYDLPQTSVMYANAFGVTQLFLTDTTFDGVNLQTTDPILMADLRNSLGTALADVTAADLMNDTVPIAPDGTITFDGLAVGTVPSGDTENLDCGTTIESAHVTLGGSSENGIYYISGTAGGKTRYQKDATHAFEYSGTRWVLIRPGADHQAAVGNQAHPWLANWTGTGIAVDEGTISQYCGGNTEPCADLTIAINGTTYGTVADPCGATAPVDVHDSNGNDVGSLVSGAWVVAPPSNVLREYTTGGTWSKPTNASFQGVWVFAAGGGGSGGAGIATTGTTYAGGSAGGGGSLVRRWVPAVSLLTTETYAIGAGANGPATGAGSAGGATLFGAHAEAKGGSGGVVGLAGATPRTGGAGGSALLNVPIASGISISGGAGGDGNRSAAGFTGVTGLLNTAAPGGGGGSGGNAGTGPFNGGVGGGTYQAGSLTAGGAGGVASGGSGTAGASNIYIDPFLGLVTATIGIGTGGGGGAGNSGASAVAGSGAAGGRAAGGGGGGSQGAGAGGTLGAGGAGGNGFLLVYEVFAI